MKNSRFILAARPNGTPKISDFRQVEEDLSPPGEGQLLVENEFLSLVPAARLRMDENIDSAYSESTPLGGAVFGQTVGIVRESRHAKYAPGDPVVVPGTGWEKFSIADGDSVVPVKARNVPLSYWIGVLGASGFTAYSGMHEIAKPRAGETVVVSSAAGSVGSIAGQIAKIAKCRVVGIAGGKDKCKYVVEQLGFDDCVDHAAGDFETALTRACTPAPSVYFDNVGGNISSAVLGRMANFGRVVICGLISEYNTNVVPASWFPVLFRRLNVQGFLTRDFEERRAQFESDMSRWLESRELKYREHVVQGLENSAAAFVSLFTGGNFGKVIVDLR